MAESTLKRLRAAHASVATLVVEDLVFLPIFQRLEMELAAEEARAGGDAIAYARAAIAARELLKSEPRVRRT
jgi:hypothetical protein